MIPDELAWRRVARETRWKDILSFLVLPILAAQPYVYRAESDLHRTIGTVLRDAGVPARHEVSLGSRANRIDIVSRGIGVEIKVAGEPPDIRRQLQRYAKSGDLRALVLLTTYPGHAGKIPELGYGIPVAVINLLGGRSLTRTLSGSLS